MGNCAAPSLAIIFMDYIERKIKEQCADVQLWKRYIDDVFFVTNGTGSSLLTVANSIHPSIQFTLETSINNQLPFLDTLVHLNNDRSFTTELFIKPSHSGTCLPYTAFAPMSRKKGLIISETLRAQRISSPHLLQCSMDKVTERLMNNGYPHRLIINTRKNIDPEYSNQPDFISFLKVPYLGENQRQQILKHQKKTCLEDKIRIVFTTESPLSWQFRPKTRPPPCPPNCIACSTSEKTGSCFKKNVVYRIKCDICSAIYIGQTERTVRTRIIEHCKVSASHVYQHLLSHGIDCVTSFKWRIVTSHSHIITRLALESLHIKNSNNIMNGCEGMHTLPFLLD